MHSSPRSKKPTEVFILFSPADRSLLDKLVTHLAVLKNDGLIRVSHSGSIEPGAERGKRLSKLMDSAGIVMPLISPEFLDSEEYGGEDMAQAFERHQLGKTRLLPIILRPCDWGGTSFGKLRVLPANGRSVAEWPTQDAAVASVVQSLRPLVADRVEVGTRWRDAQTRRIIPNELLNLCNRAEQEMTLSGMFSDENIGRRRPFLIIVHGDLEEGPDRYKSRMEHSSLPRLLGGGRAGSSSVEPIFLPFPTGAASPERGFNMLLDTLAEGITYKRQASQAEMVRVLSRFARPVMIHSYLSAERWEPNCPGILEALIKYLSDFPDLRRSTRLIVCLFVGYSKPGAQSAPDDEKRRGGNSARARAYLNSLDLSSHGGVLGCVLPKLSAVPLEEAENFFRDDRRFVEVCDRHPRSFCNTPGAVKDIRDYYNDAGRGEAEAPVPMEVLVKELRRVCEKHLC
jgi:hypothetical protein